jgi:hypothetical protein
VNEYTVQNGLSGRPINTRHIHLLRENPDLPSGIHLTLIRDLAHYAWGPFTPRKEVPSLVDQTGYFYSLEYMSGLLAGVRLGGWNRISGTDRGRPGCWIETVSAEWLSNSLSENIPKIELYFQERILRSSYRWNVLRCSHTCFPSPFKPVYQI